MTTEEKTRMIKESFEILRARKIIKTQGELAELLGISAKSLSAAKNGVNGYCTDSLISRIRGLMQEYDSKKDGLIVGETEMEDQESILIIPTSARGGTLGDFADSIKDYDCERMVSPIRGAEFAIQVTGDSMSPEYPNGCLILVKKINENAFIEWGKVYVLDTDNGAVIKKIRKTDKDNVVECVSLNPEFQPFTIDTSYINGWYRVLMVMSLK